MRTSFVALLNLAVVGVLSRPVSLACDSEGTAPRFADYPVVTIYSGPAHAVDLASDPRARRFRTRLREGATSPPNFAGHYKLIQWGCGTSCQETAIVDLVSGRVFFAAGSLVGVDHRADSALLVVNPASAIPRTEDGSAQPPGYHIRSYYYRWEEKEKTLLPVTTDDPDGFPK